MISNWPCVERVLFPRNICHPHAIQMGVYSNRWSKGLRVQHALMFLVPAKLEGKENVWEKKMGRGGKRGIGCRGWKSRKQPFNIDDNENQINALTASKINLTFKINKFIQITNYYNVCYTTYDPVTFILYNIL